MTLDRASQVVHALRGMATNEASANLLPDEQVAVTLGALAIERLPASDRDELMELWDGLFEGYCLPGAGDPP